VASLAYFMCTWERLTLVMMFRVLIEKMNIMF